MSPSKKSARKQSSLPDRVDFATWKQNVARLLAIKSPAGEAFLRWLQKKMDFARKIGNVEGAEMDALLESAYHMTRPQLASESEKKRHDFAALKVGELLPVIESTIGALKATGSMLVPKDGTPPYTFSALQQHLEAAAIEVKSALLYLERPYMREADALNHCIMFISELSGYRVPEEDALSLGRVLMKAHGFSDEDLEDFSKRSVETGKVRKRRRDYVKNWFKAGLSALETHQKLSGHVPIDITKYKPKPK
jgi:hypothetical protein